MPGPEHFQISLWGVEQDSPSPDGVEPYSPPDPASREYRVTERVELHSQGPLFVGLDTGEKDKKTVAYWRGADGSEQYAEYVDPTDAARDPRWTPGTVIVFENSVYGFKVSRRPEFDAALRERGLVPHPIDPRHTKNRRRTWFPEETKTRDNQNDRLDALVLWRIGDEGVIKPTTNVWARSLVKAVDCVVGAERKPRDPHEVLLINLRRHDLEHPSVPQALRDVVRRTLEHRPIPVHAIDAGLARRVGGLGRWNEPAPDYRLLTMLVIALESKSKGQAKALLRRRGLARANLMHHPLKNQKSRRDRKKVMRAQDRLVAWLIDSIVSKQRAEYRHQLRVVKEDAA